MQTDSSIVWYASSHFSDWLLSAFHCPRRYFLEGNLRGKHCRPCLTAPEIVVWSRFTHSEIVVWSRFTLHMHTFLGPTWVGLHSFFPWCESQFWQVTLSFSFSEQNLIQTYSLENLLGERKKAHQIMLSGKQYLEGDSCSSSEEGDDENHKNNLKELVSSGAVWPLGVGHKFFTLHIELSWAWILSFQ